MTIIFCDLWLELRAVRARNSITLKLFALLLFSFELMAPLFLLERELANEVNQYCVQSADYHGLGIATALLCEEAGSEEEREGKDHKVFVFPAEVNFVAVFQCIIQQYNQLKTPVSISTIRTGTSLLAFIQEYRI
jgi:hypothetical protein